MRPIFLLISLLLIPFTFAGEKTICGNVDDRTYVESNTKVLRLSREGKYKGCTATMISKKCAITAGHCKKALYKGEINPPKSNDYGSPRPTKKENSFLVDTDTIKYEYDAYSDYNGKDWAVFKFQKNDYTGKYPGENNNYYEVDFKREAHSGDEIEIYGFGLDHNNPTLSSALQHHKSEITALEKNDIGELSIIQHTIDTMGGNSGAAILRKSDTNPNIYKIIGVHTNGGCTSAGGANEGTSILGKPEFLAAIKACLGSE